MWSSLTQVGDEPQYRCVRLRVRAFINDVCAFKVEQSVRGFTCMAATYCAGLHLLYVYVNLRWWLCTTALAYTCV